MRQLKSSKPQGPAKGISPPITKCDTKRKNRFAATQVASRALAQLFDPWERAMGLLLERIVNGTDKDEVADEERETKARMSAAQELILGTT